MGMTGFEDEIRRRLLWAQDTGRVEGLLFHSTAEPIVGPLHGDGLDVLWTARDPWVSAQYIPSAGSEILLARPDDWRLKDRVAPARHNALYGFACEMSGKECSDVEWDWDGRAKSWRVPDGWPTYGDVVGHIEDHYGYVANSNGVYYVRESAGVVMPADWQIEGQVFVALDDGLHFKDVRRSGEPDLTEREYYDGDAFERATDQGYDGVIINDHCQADDYGNVPHLSFGLNAVGREKVEWAALPAVRRHLDPWFSGEAILTPDLDAWLACFEMEAVHAI
jgi:hypothetical protein